MFDRVLIRETAGLDRVTIVEKYEVGDKLTSWFPTSAPAEIVDTIRDLADAINTGSYTGDLATALGVTVEIVDWRTLNWVELAAWLTLRGVTADRLDAEIFELLGKTSDELDEMYAAQHND